MAFAGVCEGRVSSGVVFLPTEPAETAGFLAVVFWPSWPLNRRAGRIASCAAIPYSAGDVSKASKGAEALTVPA